MTYNIIGDIHGTDVWKQLVLDDAVNIFLGDYLDPKHDRHDQPDPTGTGDVCNGSAHYDQIRNLLDIIRYKQLHPQTVLLLGNHDLHYLIPERYSSYDEALAPTYHTLLEVLRPYIYGVAYSIENQLLVSHAGVTGEWLKQHAEPEYLTPDRIAKEVNRVAGFDAYSPLRPYDASALMQHFSAEATLAEDDYCGESATASPLWVRPESLMAHSVFAEHPQFLQAVGHTPVEQITVAGGCLFCDCLLSLPQSLEVTSSPDGTLHYDRHNL